MSLEWIEEKPAKWNADKARIIGGAPVGVFDVRFARLQRGELLPGQWWRVEQDGKTLGYGWLDVVWGDAEITLATDPEARGKGVGSFVVDKLEEEAKKQGINYLYNTVRPSHPERDSVSAWLQKRGFRPSEDGSLFRSLAVSS